MYMKKINIAYKSLFIIFLSIILILIYFHKYNYVKKLCYENKKIQSDMEKINSHGDLKDVIVKANDEFRKIQAVILPETETAGFIKQLKQKAKIFGIEVLSITPHDSEIYRDGNGNDVKALDASCKSMPISLNVRAGYMALGEFLLDVGRNEKQLIKLSEMDMRKDNSSHRSLNVNIKMVVYLLGK
jgi:Tfp pilus assembly protein PilO